MWRKPDLQFGRIEVRMPGPDRIVRVVEHAHQLDRQRLDVARARVHVGPRARRRRAIAARS